MQKQSSSSTLKNSNTAAENYFDLCKSLYEPKSSRKAFELPAWLNGIQNDQEAARTCFVALEAAILIACRDFRFDDSALQKLQRKGAGGSLTEWLRAKVSLPLLVNNEKDTVIDSAFNNLIECIRFEGESNFISTSDSRKISIELLELCTEAAGRQAGLVTPPDVANIMARLAGTEDGCDVYVTGGLGLFFANQDSTSKFRLVGNDFGNQNSLRMPQPMRDAYSGASTWYRNGPFTDRVFADLVWRYSEPGRPGGVLLVNAANERIPFFEATENSLGGPLNDLLTSGYSRIIVLVPNSYLTAGRISETRTVRADGVLKYLLTNGLRKVIQLPMGVLGNRNQSHSILVFQKDVSGSSSVEFVEIPLDPNSRSASKGFGLARRAYQLIVDNICDDGLPSGCYRNSLEVHELIKRNAGSGSFEVGRFIDIDVFEKFRDRFKFVKISSFMEIFRARSIRDSENEGDESLREIGVADISNLGYIRQGALKITLRDEIEKSNRHFLREGDLVLCFRGSSSSIGRVGWLKKDPEMLTIANQSLLVLRIKENRTLDAPPPGLVFWWLRSIAVQKYFALKAVTPGVNQLSPNDIYELEVPSGPAHEIEREIKDLEDFCMLVEKLESLRSAGDALLMSAWTA